MRVRLLVLGLLLSVGGSISAQGVTGRAQKPAPPKPVEQQKAPASAAPRTAPVALAASDIVQVAAHYGPRRNTFLSGVVVGDGQTVLTDAAAFLDALEITVAFTDQELYDVEVPPYDAAARVGVLRLPRAHGQIASLSAPSVALMGELEALAGGAPNPFEAVQVAVRLRPEPGAGRQIRWGVEPPLPAYFRGGPLVDSQGRLLGVLAQERGSDVLTGVPLAAFVKLIPTAVPVRVLAGPAAPAPAEAVGPTAAAAAPPAGPVAPAARQEATSEPVLLEEPEPVFSELSLPLSAPALGWVWKSASAPEEQAERAAVSASTEPAREPTPAPPQPVPPSAPTQQITALILKANRQNEEKDYAGAVATLEEALRAYPDQPRLHYHLAFAYWYEAMYRAGGNRRGSPEKSAYRKAMREFETFLARAPDDPVATYARAQLELLRGKHSESREPPQPATAAREQIEAAPGPAVEPPASPQPEPAAPVAAQPETAATPRLEPPAATTVVVPPEPVPSIPELELSLAGPPAGLVWEGVGPAFLPAIGAAGKNAGPTPEEDITAIIARANRQNQEKDYLGAVATLEQAARSHPEQSQLHYHLGFAYWYEAMYRVGGYRRGSPEKSAFRKAIREFETFLARAPDDPRAPDARSQLEALRGKRPGAQEPPPQPGVLATAPPESAPPASAAAPGAPQEAGVQAETAAAPVEQRELAAAAAVQQQTPLAVANPEGSLGSEEVRAIIARSGQQNREMDYGGAAATLEEAIRSHPDEPQLHYYLGFAYWYKAIYHPDGSRRGSMEGKSYRKAIREFETFLAAAPSDPRVPDAKLRLEILRSARFGYRPPKR